MIFFIKSIALVIALYCSKYIGLWLRNRQHIWYTCSSLIIYVEFKICRHMKIEMDFLIVICISILRALFEEKLLKMISYIKEEEKSKHKEPNSSLY